MNFVPYRLQYSKIISDFALVVKNRTYSTKMLIISKLQNIAFQDWGHFD